MARRGFGELGRRRRGQFLALPGAELGFDRPHRLLGRRQRAEQYQDGVVRGQVPVAEAGQRGALEPGDRFQRGVLAGIRVRSEEQLGEFLVRQEGSVGALGQQLLRAVLFLELQLVLGKTGVAGHVRHQVQQLRQVLAERVR